MSVSLSQSPFHGFSYVNCRRRCSATILYPSLSYNKNGAVNAPTMQIVEIAMSGTVGTCHMGPVSTNICELAKRFAERGHDVIVVDVRAEEPRPLLHPHIRLLELSAVPQSRVANQSQNQVIAQLKRWRNCYRFVSELTYHLDVSQADVIHFHAPVPAFLAQRLHGLDSVFYTAHTPTWSLVPSSRRSPITRFMTWVQRDVIRKSRMTVGFGDYLADAVPGANVVTIPNGLDLEAWPLLERSEARRALGIGEHEFVLLFAGRISAVKGVDTLLDAVRRVAPSLNDASVFVIGPLSGSIDTRDEFVHPYARSMVELARGLPVQFLGFINNRELKFRQYLASADVFVLPSRSEPQGVVVLEALAMGTPVIGSATGGIPDMIASDVGVVFEPGNAAALADCIRRAHERPQELRAMQSAARASVQLRYSWDSVADRHLAGFKRCLANDATKSLGSRTCRIPP